LVKSNELAKYALRKVSQKIHDQEQTQPNETLDL